MPKTAVAPIDLKEACVRAAHEFIAEQGVERLSLRDVARRLGVSHQAPYKHYPSRDHLLAEVIRRCYRDFAIYLDARGEHVDPWADLGALGQRYQAYAASHPVEYRLMFGTPWPLAGVESGLAAEATHAFDVLRTVLRRIHGPQKSRRAQVDLDALFIWSNMHGMASISQSNVMSHLGLAPGVARQAQEHQRTMMGHAMAHTVSEGDTA
jgi:AcrR family transcriptional regulator